MNTLLYSAVCQLGQALRKYLQEDASLSPVWKEALEAKMREANVQNSWFTHENMRFALAQWAGSLEENALSAWLSKYPLSEREFESKKIGLILAGNIPLVGFHDVLCVLFSGHEALVKFSSKDSELIPFLLETIQSFCSEKLRYQRVEKLEKADAVIATGSNNTAQYLEYYFRNIPHIIRKNRTSVAVLDGKESDEELKALARDIFTYFGMGCRNVTRLFLPEDFPLSRLFENFMEHGDCIHHHAYANNYDYNKAIYLLNQDNFWDNNFIMLKEDEALFSPLSVLHFSRYKELAEVRAYLSEHCDSIQCVVSKSMEGINIVGFGEAQCPSMEVYADNVDTMQFLIDLS